MPAPNPAQKERQKMSKESCTTKTRRQGRGEEWSGVVWVTSCVDAFFANATDNPEPELGLSAVKINCQLGEQPSRDKATATWQTGPM
ncbi:hypothetical protein ACLKA6_001667 [Drosophila palustris]